MTKIVKLTEQDLIRLVNRVINEQPMGTPSTIKIKLNGDMCDVDPKPVKKSWGCAFLYRERGEEGGQRQLNFVCADGKITAGGGERNAGMILKASPQAKDLLKKACGCSSYASNSSNQSTSNYV